MKVLVVDLNRADLKLANFEFVKPILRPISSHQTSVVHYSQVNDGVLSTSDAAILSGTTLKDIGYLHDIDCFRWVLDYPKPLLGICAGMQALALTYGSTTFDCLEVGMTEIQTVKDNRLFTGKFSAYSLHKKAVDVSHDFDVLAKSSQCIQAIKHKSKKKYGVLFHPEVRTADVMGNFLGLL